MFDGKDAANCTPNKSTNLPIEVPKSVGNYTVIDSPNKSTNLPVEIPKSSEAEKAIRATCTKEVVVKLYRLPESTVNDLLSRSRQVPSAPDSGDKAYQKEIFRKCLLPKLESRLTDWVKKKAQKSGGPVHKYRVFKKAKQIFERLKAQGGEKYKNITFFASKTWYNFYQNRHKVNNRLSLQDPFKSQPCNNVCLEKNTSVKTSVSAPVGSDEDEDWCKRTKADLLHEKARDLMMDALSCSFFSYGSVRDEQKRTTRRPQEEVEKELKELCNGSVIPMSNFEVDSELSSSDVCEVDYSEATSTTVETINKSVDNVEPLVITIEDDEMQNMTQYNSLSTISVAAFARNGCMSSDSKLGVIENRTSQVPFFKSVTNENEPVRHFRRKLEKIIKQENYIPQQIFCVQETTLYWKHMPVNCSVLGLLDDELPESKDPMMLLMCTNASGDCRLEPMLVYSKEDPPPIRHLIKSSLPVIWKFHPRAKITNSLFEDWFTYSFVPTVQVFCIEHRIPFQVLLLLDSAPCHNPVLEFAHPNIKVLFLPPDIARYVQPMEQGITATFKVNYLRRMFEMMAEAVEFGNGETVQSFWNSFTILSALKLIKTAWLDVSQLIVTLAWKIMCLGTIPKDSDNGNPFSNVIAPVVCAAERLKVNISERDIANWLIYQSHELTNDELKALEQHNCSEVFASSDEMPPVTMTPDKLLEAFTCLKTAMKIFESEDPNFKRSSFVIDEIKRSYRCYKEVYSELKNGEARKNSISEDVCDDVKVEDDIKHSLTTDVKPSSSLVKWFSSSSSSLSNTQG